jgi:hypothetical protein
MAHIFTIIRQFYKSWTDRILDELMSRESGESKKGVEVGEKGVDI